MYVLQQHFYAPVYCKRELLLFHIAFISNHLCVCYRETERRIYKQALCDLIGVILHKADSEDEGGAGDKPLDSRDSEPVHLQFVDACSFVDGLGLS